MKSLERRVVAQPIQLRAGQNGKPATIQGYAAVFGAEAVIGGMFRERIEPGAFRSVLADGADVRALFNHDDNLVLGRTTNGTLRLSEDERGLRYEFDPNPDDPDAVSIVAKIRRGDVTQSSYGFRVKDGGEQWTRSATRGELPLRTITEFELLRDVSPVTFAAFDDTTAEARSQAEALRADASESDTGKHKTASGKVAKHYAGTDGTSYPIEDPIDVHNAAQAIGRDNKGAADRAKVKANIIRIAYELGAKYVAQLPNDWKHKEDQRSAEEQAELITYNALKSTLADIAGHLSSARDIVDSLIANETHDDPAAPADEDDEEQIEQAQLAALAVLARQLAGAAAGLQSLTCSSLDYGYGYYSAASLATARAAVDLLELEA